LQQLIEKVPDVRNRAAWPIRGEADHECGHGGWLVPPTHTIPFLFPFPAHGRFLVLLHGKGFVSISRPDRL
jgi:hypothetical protein